MLAIEVEIGRALLRVVEQGLSRNQAFDLAGIRRHVGRRYLAAAESAQTSNVAGFSTVPVVCRHPSPADATVAPTAAAAAPPYRKGTHDAARSRSHARRGSLVRRSPGRQRSHVRRGRGVRARPPRLDAIHGGEVPPTTEVLTDKRDVLFTVAEAAIEELVDHGVDALRVELVLARLEDARALDRP